MGHEQSIQGCLFLTRKKYFIGLVLSMCSIIQSITLRCPGALVWHYFGEDKRNPVLSGSPLDLLHCAPSSLPMPQGVDNQHVSSDSHFHSKHM